MQYQKPLATVAKSCLALFLFCAAEYVFGQESSWLAQVKREVARHDLDAASVVIEERILRAPADLEARGWHARLLAWKGEWPEAETEYRFVLERAPDDTDILIGYADVLMWQNRSQEALPSLDHARTVAPKNPEVLLRRGRVLGLLGRTRESRDQLRELLRLDPENTDAKKVLEGLEIEPKQVIRIGTDIDTFSFADVARAHSLTISSRWNRYWSSEFVATGYQRFGESAEKFTAEITLHPRERDWLSALAGAGQDNGIIPKRELLFEYGHGFRFRHGWLRGAEASYQQHWLWYRAAHVMTLGATQTTYLPREWTLRFSGTGARSGFMGSGVEWVPSGSARIGFPLYRTLSGSLTYAVGTENFAQVDQIGRFSARTYAGGLRYRFCLRHDIDGYIAKQDRSQGRSETSYGLSYGFYF